MERKAKPGGIVVQMPEREGAFKAHDFNEAVRREKGNALVAAMAQAMERAGQKAEISPLGEGRFLIRGSGGEAVIEDSFGEDENGLGVPGSRFRAECLRQPWFRKALCEALGYSDEGALYGALAEGKPFDMPSGAAHFIFIAPAGIFDEAGIARLEKAGKAIGAPNVLWYADYLDRIFSAALGNDFVVHSPSAPGLRAVTARGLRSLVEEDEAFQKAVKAAKDILKAFLEEAEKDPAAVRRKIIAQHSGR